MLVFIIIISAVLYVLIGLFVLGLETGMNDVTEFQLMLYILCWPLYYIYKLMVIIGKGPFRLGLYVRKLLGKEDDNERTES